MPNRREPDRPTPVNFAEAHRTQEQDLVGPSATSDLAREIAGFIENQPRITREILESFLACKTRSYLKLSGQRGTKSDFEALSTEIRSELRDRTFENLISRLNPEDVMRGVTITEAILKIGAAIILDVVCSPKIGPAEMGVSG